MLANQPETRKCGICGSEFTVNFRTPDNHKFCGRTCTQKTHRQKTFVRKDQVKKVLEEVSEIISKRAAHLLRLHIEKSNLF